MTSTNARRGVTVAFIAAAITVLAAAVGWACTLTVGATELTSTTGDAAAVSSNEAGSVVIAKGTVNNLVGDVGRCGDSTPDADADCKYRFGIVSPDQVENGNPQGDGNHSGHAPTCHYATPESQVASHDDSTVPDVDNQFMHLRDRDSNDPYIGNDDKADSADPPAALHLPSATSPGQRELVQAGNLSADEQSSDNVDADASGPTLACFYSMDKLDADGPSDGHLNGQKNGAANATIPAPFVVLN